MDGLYFLGIISIDLCHGIESVISCLSGFFLLLFGGLSRCLFLFLGLLSALFLLRSEMAPIKRWILLRQERQFISSLQVPIKKI